MGDNRLVTAPTKGHRADEACLAATDVARAALVELVGEGDVGEHAGHQAEADRVVTHYFAAQHAGYQGWRWAVTVARAAHRREVTVDEIVLLPGPSAVVAPPWVPWRERVQAEDVAPGSLLPAEDSDPRLVPGYTGADEDLDERAVRAVIEELGLGRARVLSPEGRVDVASRWYAGSHGPEAAVAQAAPAPCATCGFVVRLAGSLGNVFGVCANEYSPSDGKVVSFDHGCGAHSEARETATGASAAATVPEPAFDTIGYDDIERF